MKRQFHVKFASIFLSYSIKRVDQVLLHVAMRNIYTLGTTNSTIYYYVHYYYNVCDH